jgi:predicted HAD superfamily Cof-like phosphohydrolase
MIEDLREFHTKFDMIVSDKPTRITQRLAFDRITCLQEELNEFADAVRSRDFGEQADALVDLVYFAIGTAAMMGLPWQSLWDDVHRANMAKERGIGKRGISVDCIKPTGWVPPNTVEILNAHGFDPEAEAVDYE